MDERKHHNVWLNNAILASEDLNNHAAELARNHIVSKSAKSLKWLIHRVNDNYRFISEVYRELGRNILGVYPGAPAAEWLLDNFYIIEEQFKIIRKNLSRGRYSRLPVLKEGQLRGYPRVYAIALELVAHTDGKINEKIISEFINSYQVHSPLSMGELWALALMLRIALLENIANICEDMLNSQRGYQRAERIYELISDALKSPAGPSAGTSDSTGKNHESPGAYKTGGKQYAPGLEKVIEQIKNEEITPSFTEHLLMRLRKNGNVLSEITSVLESKLKEQNLSTEMIATFEHRQQAERQVSIGNTITGLRLISEIDWSDIFESLSVVEQILREDPGGIYAEMDFESRDLYRHEVEKLALKYNTTEINIARKAVQCAEEYLGRNDIKTGEDINTGAGIEDGDDTGNDDYIRAHVGYYIIGKGRTYLPARLRNREKTVSAGVSPVQATAGKTSVSLYIFLISAVTAILTFLFSFYSYISGVDFRIFRTAVTALLVLIPCSEIARNFINLILSHINKPSILPKLELKNGIPDELSTMVIIPTLLPSEKRVRDLAAQLEIMYLGNKDPNLYFALLGDFKDNNEKNAAEDEKIIKTGLKCIEELNKKYPSRQKPVFYFLHRERSYCETQQRWTGWERKRGAILEFNKLILGSKDTGYIYLSHPAEELPRVKYVITLDADTIMPMGTARKLIGAMAHPLNKARIDRRKRIVTSGYGLIQPRISVGILDSNRSYFTKIFAGQGGIDPYTTAVSDIYQDTFREGIFTGKGIYDLEVFQSVLDKRLPQGSILSHDLLEGSYLRTGLATDIELVDGFPSGYNTHSMRSHRWTRGDWQLLPWLCSRVRNEEGALVENPLSTLSKWKIFDNLRRSVIAPFLMVLILAGVSVLPGSFLVWIGLALFVIILPLLTYAADIFLSGNFEPARYSKGITSITGFKAGLYQAALLFAFLPHQAYLMMDAIIRTISRLVTRKRLLEWVTAADAEEGSRNTLTGYINRMRIVFAVSVLIIILSLLRGPGPATAVAVLFALTWLLSPFAACYISKPLDHGKDTPSKETREKLRELAESTWGYFRDFVVKEDNYLPPDNYQEDPPKGVAHRTSPTNIGMCLLSVLSAWDLGFIGRKEFVDYIGKIITSVEKMEKWKGHLYNWYNTITLKAMRPLYVSTVDSGNFVGSLMIVREGLLELLPGDGEVRERDDAEVKELSDRIRALIDNTEFAPLYDKKRQLFSIGFNAEDGQLSKSYYDLLASEARLASYIAIARGEIDQRHWFRLGRKLASDGGYKGLLSWTGTMFEYLMPLIFMKNYENTILGETYNFVVRMQKKYSSRKGIPWGISESGFNAFDINLSYQYKAFGVPELGLKRGLGNDTVVAPYASVLAVEIDPEGLIENIEELEKLGMKGKYGFYEAIDFTRTGSDGETGGKARGSIVKSYMAHHQGMCLAAINNYLNYGILKERFHRIPVIKAAELLLQEKSPQRGVFIKGFTEEIVPADKKKEKETEDIPRIFGIPNANIPAVHLLSNGDYSLMLTDGGAGYSRFKDIAVTRWTGDKMNETGGMFIYVQNINSNNAWSAAFEPMKFKPEKYNVVFSADKAKYERRDGNIETTMEVTVSPEDNCEIRLITLTNRSEHVRVLELTSYMEIVLSPPEDDFSHMAFSKLFVRTEFVREKRAIVANRRSRKENGSSLWFLHTMAVDGNIIGEVQYETDRLKFIGRNRNLSEPAAMEPDQPLSNSAGAVLDPVASLRCRIRLEPGETRKLSFVAAVAETRKNALELAEKYGQLQASERVFDLAWIRSKVENRYLGNDASDTKLFLDSAPFLLYHNPFRVEYADMILKNTGNQSDLWPLGISGDLPILLTIIGSQSETDLALFALKAHEYWRMKGLAVDLVFIIENETGYNQPLKEFIRDSAGSIEKGVLNRKGGVFILNKDEMEYEQYVLLITSARLIWKDSIEYARKFVERNLEMYVEYDDRYISEITGHCSEISTAERCMYDELAHSLKFFNGIGGFGNDGKEYVIKLEAGKNTPAPWVNVISNEKFGFLATETGGGYVWSVNSRENKLTRWCNDPVTDDVSEAVYVRDEETREIWSIAPKPIRDDAVYKVTHGFGYTVYEHPHCGLEQSMTVYVALEDSVKITAVNIRNKTGSRRKLSLIYYLRPVLGESEIRTAPFIVTSFDEESGMLFIENKFAGEFRGRIAYMDTSIDERSFTGDRREFFGPGGSTGNPLNLVLSEKLGGSVGAGLDSCGALMVKFELEEDEGKTVIFLFGQEESREKAVETARKYKNPRNALDELERVKAFWSQILGRIKVETPDKAFDVLINGWLLYQVISCRLWSRSAFYQSGGAFGFRDQLQDSMSTLMVWPELSRKQILLHASRQFREGDVQHWWHMETGRGIRTRYSDDLLWLPYVTSEYVEKTGDYSILDEEVGYIDAPSLEPGEDERYEIPINTDFTSTIYEHCCRAIERALKFGTHGLPLMGSGDWNDGMNKVGREGKGESVWLGWFLVTVLKKFILLGLRKGDNERINRYKKIMEDLTSAIEREAWDGSWYRRAYFDDGTPLGSVQNAECMIDSIAQSWSVISEAGKAGRAKESMDAVMKYLVDREEGIIKLLTPPFDNGPLKPGYIKGYVPGVRENGGQYTHAAAWVVLAFAKLKMGNVAWELFGMVNPVNHTRTPFEISRYKTEPYVVAADVYAVPPNAGRGGWTWYTGAAGWLYRTGIEYLLGFKKKGNVISFDPCIPENWEGFRIQYKYGSSTYLVEVTNPVRKGGRITAVEIDGKPYGKLEVELLDDGNFHVIKVQ